MKKLMFFIPAMLCALHGIAQNKYPASAIPAALFKNANVVVREYDVQFEVKNKKEGIEREHRVVTILNKAGLEEAEPVFVYSSLLKIEDIEAAVYDAEGKLVRRLKNRDISDQKPYEQFVDDYRCKVLNLPAHSLPFTVEYTVETRCNGLMFYPVFQPQKDPGMAVEHAKLSISMPPGMEYRVKTVNLPANAATSPNQWEFAGIPAFVPEPFTPLAQMPFARVLTAPNEFEFGGHAGDLHSWESYGAFSWELNQTQANLPPETCVKLKDMVADCPDAECKVRRLYDYLQHNTRYFFIGLGIGGWQPAPASEVDALKYGDCKGLSNYMVAMLKAVGVTGYYTIIRAGNDEKDAQYSDFPNAHFNHIVVCVPLERDTMWLECTSQTESCGFMSDFTDDRPALMITPQGGKLVRTPKYDEKTNLIRRQTRLTLAEDGSGEFQSTDVFSGIPQKILAELSEYPDEIRRKYLYKTLQINDFEIKKISFERDRSRIPSVTQQLELHLPQTASVSGKRMFLPLSLMCSRPEVPFADSLRRTPVQADSRGYTEENTTTVLLPEGYRPDNIPQPLHVESLFGSFDLNVQAEAGKVLIYRKLIINSSIQPKERIQDLAQFFKSVSRADKSKIVLVKGT